MRDLIVWVAGVCLLALVVPFANAELITIQIEGVVDTVDDSGNYLEGQVNPGDIITGWYTYDTDTPDSNPSENVGDYEHSASQYGVSLTVGGFTFMTDPANVDFLLEVVNDYPTGDDFGFISYSNLDLDVGTQVDIIKWHLNDPTGAPLYSDTLPLSAPVLAEWDWNQLRIHGERGGYIIDGHVTFAIPEPCTLLFLGLGVLSVIRKVR